MMILVVSVDSRSDDDAECLSKMIEYRNGDDGSET